MAIKINGTNTAAAPGITGDDTDTGLVYGTNQVDISTGGSSRVTVDSSGNVGIGTTSPDSMLHVSGASGSGQLRLTRNNAASNGNDYGRIYFESTDDVLTGQISVARESAENDGYMHFKTASGGTLTERMRFLSDGGLTFNGDTASANALSDYEEGTWTIDPWDGSCTTTYAKYRKIGNQVTVWVRATAFSDTSTNDQIRLKGLPYNPSSSWAGAAGSAMIQNVSEDAGWMAFAQTDQIRFYASSTGGYDQLRHNELSSSHAIYFFATYPVN